MMWTILMENFRIFLISQQFHLLHSAHYNEKTYVYIPPETSVFSLTVFVLSIEIKCNLEVKAKMNKIILCYLFWNTNSKFNNSSNLWHLFLCLRAFQTRLLPARLDHRLITLTSRTHVVASQSCCMSLIFFKGLPHCNQ